METDNSKVLLVPCSGIGKVHGLVAREAVYEAVRQCAGTATTMCLALLVTGDDEAVGKVRRHPAITVDGCPKLCAFKNVELAGGQIAHEVRVVDAFKGHRGVNGGSATVLDGDGWLIADEIAQKLARKVCAIAAGREGE